MQKKLRLDGTMLHGMIYTYHQAIERKTIRGNDKKYTTKE
jgi:hypothetical protein